MHLIVGLGNPGDRYRNSRHNAGWMVLDRWAEHHGLRFRRVFDNEILEHRGCLIVKPMLYMNRSGRAIKGLYKSKNIEQMLVIVDDIYLPVGRLRLRQKGGAGGHNGLADIIAELQTSDFPRLRFGVGEPGRKDMRDHVLGDFAKADRELVDQAVGLAVELLDIYIQHDITATLDHYSRASESYSEASPQDRQSDNPVGRRSPKEEE